MSEDIELEEALPQPMSLVQFCLKHGLTTTADVDAHIHAGLRSAPQTKTYARWNKAALAELQASRDDAVRQYRAAIAAGEIRDFTDMEKLEAAASGHDDNLATQAARRVLAKRLALRAAKHAAESTQPAHTTLDAL